MANTALALDVDDTSPTILYFPFGDSFSIPNFTAGWNPLFNQTSFGGAPLEVENSTSVHITSRNNASFSLNWKGTGIQLFGYATNATYTILLDGSSRDANSTATILASIQNLDNLEHEILLTTIISDTTQNQTSSFIVFDKATILAPPAFDSTTVSSNFTSQSLNDSAISLNGDWDFQNNSVGGFSPVYISSNPNDSASAKFNGTALQIFGTVSPQGGNYTIKLDNLITQYSANASFTQNDTLLFVAGALDPNVGHDVQILNNGGILILPFDGFVAFSSQDPNSSTTSTTPSGGNLSSDSIPKGTIAALALAGILAFLLISALLFFIFVWRPMKIRHRQARRERHMLAQDASRGGGDAVLNIGRHTPSYNHSPTGSRETHRSQKSNSRSGFLRWKREMEAIDGGKVLGALGLVFRHSYSPKEKEPSFLDDDDPYEDGSGSRKSSKHSSGSPTPSTRGKGKSRWTGKSKQDAPSYTIDLPPLNQSQEQFEQEIPSLLVPPAAHTPFSGFTSLTYMSTPDTRNSREFSFNAPPNRLSNVSQSLSRPPSPDYGKADSNGALLVHDRFERQTRSEETESEVDFHSSIVSTHQEPELQVHVQEFEVQSTDVTFSSRRSENRRASMYAREMDRGSVRTNDDGLSVLGPATARAAIRSLSPRTSELAFTNLSIDQLPTSTTQRTEDDARVPRERLISDETLRPQSQELLADVDSARRVHRRTTESASRKSARLSVRFEDDANVQSSNLEGAGAEADLLTVPARVEEGPRTIFRLTPQRPVTSPISEVDSNIATSFLDLSSSNSNSNSDSSRREPSLASQGQGLKSRWSATTTTDFEPHNLRQESSDSQNSGGSASSPSSNFPFPVSLPASPHHPEGFKPSRPVTPSLGSNPQLAPGRLNVHLHPFGITMNPASPSDSVPMSISDLHFRHSDSENDDLSTDPTAGAGTHLPPHPPLPSPTPTFPLSDAPSHAASPVEALSSPSYIVSRVFPHSRSNSAADPYSQSAQRTASGS
ncbi:hypothetical protein J3R30DRAFT_3698737 [Lentinula aciculospora]|uniref:Uncharacterized protein n=1 Tax=Lentinula aciculospora TaxID=153920 RepID=A0A9W9AIZ0_9AGAR|nr:hypothetical protein J3R30DRAFT_3698737 [Lentinula aciculospora]